MTRVRMVADRTGGRYDGQDWPVPPGEFDVPGGEAQHLIARGDAVAVEQPEQQPAGPRGAESPADAPEPGAPAKPGINAPKAAWVEHAAAHGMDEAEAAGMTKSDLIDALG